MLKFRKNRDCLLENSSLIHVFTFALFTYANGFLEPFLRGAIVIDFSIQ
jgi:hypothetical protein